MDEDRPVGFEDEQTDSLRQHGRQATGVDNLAAGDDQAHGGRPYCPLRTCPAGLAIPCRGALRLVDYFELVERFAGMGKQLKANPPPGFDIREWNALPGACRARLSHFALGVTCLPEDSWLYCTPWSAGEAFFPETRLDSGRCLRRRNGNSMYV
jgi:hypothetical protein